VNRKKIKDSENKKNQNSKKFINEMMINKHQREKEDKMYQSFG
jgi:hypothetical protein